MRQKHSLAQVFLKDKKIIKRIMDNLDIKGKEVCEIGPGQGNVTEQLLKEVSFLWCVEIDSRLCSELKKKFSTYDNIKIINSDVLEFSFSSLGRESVVFGNVPYYISSELISHLIEHHRCIDKAYLMFQKEFVQKLIAKEGTKGYCFLSCFLQYFSHLNKLFDIPPGAFSPHPGVESSFIKIEFYDSDSMPHKAKDEKVLFDIIRKAFSQRRKKIINSLDFLKGKEDLLGELGISASSRPADISLEEYVALANAVNETGL